MPIDINRVKALHAEGAKFTYDNFRSKVSRHGYPSALSPEWIVWTSKVQQLVRDLKTSPSVSYINAGLSMAVLGNAHDTFETAHAYLLGGLEAAQALLSEDPLHGAAQSTGRDPSGSRKVFIVHGHDERAKHELEILLAEFGLESIVLHRQADQGLTLTEKFEKYSDVGYAFILLTPDDIGYAAPEEKKPDADRMKELRARQNVIFECGFFVAKLSRANVCCLYTGGVSLPSDVQMVYKAFNKHVEEAAHSIRKDLQAQGFVLR